MLSRVSLCFNIQRQQVYKGFISSSHILLSWIRLRELFQSELNSVSYSI
jgi:hypothetical protein